MSVVQTLTRYIPSYSTVIAFHSANLNALVKANAAYVDGLQAISKEVLAEIRTQVETVVASAKTVREIKTLKDATDLAVSGAKGNYEKFVATSTRLSELGVKVVNDTLAPVTGRVEEIVKSATAASVVAETEVEAATAEAPVAKKRAAKTAA